MKRSALSRYERSLDGLVVIDVAAQKLEDLYSNFDRSAPYIRRDLDPELVAYLISSAREIGTEPFLIRLTLEQAPDEARLNRIRSSVKSYFAYLADTARERMMMMLRRAAILLGIGLGILFLSVWLHQYLGEGRSIASDVFAEGLTVAAWVSLWEALATVLIEWMPHRRTLRIYNRMSVAPLLIVERTEPNESFACTEPANVKG